MELTALVPASFTSFITSSTTNEWIYTHALLVVLITLIAVAVPTRLHSVKSSKINKNEVPSVPYWLPILGHIPNMIWDSTKFMHSEREAHKEGAYSLNFGGSTHTILYKPTLVSALFGVKESQASHDEVGDLITERVFGYPLKKELATYRAIMPEMRASFVHLTNEADLSLMVKQTASRTKRTASNLVSFSPSLVDQAYWERTADAKLAVNKDGEQVVAANLVDLVRDYCAYQSNPSILGSDFLDNFPDVLSDLWTIDRGFLYLAAGLPRWVPIPLVTRAHIARRKVLRAWREWEQAVDDDAAGKDPGSRWRNIDDVGSIIHARVRIYRKHDVSMAARASFDFGLIWAMNANSNMLVFWMLNRIYADNELLASVREEMMPYIEAVQPKQTFAVPEPPTLRKFEVDKLCTECPLLKSIYVECLRLDAGTWSFKQVNEDFELKARGSSTAYTIRKGQYIHAAHDLHNTNPEYFSEPEKFIADRHIKTDDKGRRIADLGTIRPYGGGSSMCKGRAFAFKECMMFAAAIVAMWDIERAGGGPWKMPKARKATGVFATGDPTRVWLKRRTLIEV